MTIDEAKICLSIQLEVKHRLGKDYEAQALQLGIEALKQERHLRIENPSYQNHRLPGETEE